MAKEKIYQYKLEKNEKLKKAGQVLQLFTEEDIPQDTLFYDTQKRAFSILEKNQLNLIAKNMTTDLHFDEKEFQWEALESLGLRYKRYLRPLLLAIPFIEESPQSDFLQCLHFLKEVFLKGQSLHHLPDCEIPTSFLSKKDKKYLYKKGEDQEKDGSKAKTLIRDRYEFHCYRLLRNRLESGDIFCRESVSFRSFEEDLIDCETWKKNKHALIQRARLPLLDKPIQAHLAELEKQLDALLQDVNQRIEDGNNKCIKITKKKNKKSWTFVSSNENDTLKTSFFEILPQVSLLSVLRFTQQNCHFMEAFDHVLEHSIVCKRDENTLLASLIAWGTNTGLMRMGQISDIDYMPLSQASDHFIRLETLHKANQLICDKIAQTSIFEDHNLGGVYHSSSDGQKFETIHPTFNARHSPKYFGLKKGIVAYSFVLNNIPFWAKIIGAHEHESHYVFDLLHNNASDIAPKLHSTDTHGTNQVNFAILHVFGYQFAPRYRNIANKMQTGLYSFKKHPKEGFFKPVRSLKKHLIIDHWDWIQRIMVSLALKQTTQSLITSKLSSYSRKNKVQKALWEYDNIFSSLYLLNYVDTPSLRHNVHRALNRGENYNKLRKAVAFSHFGKLRFKTENEQQIWQECSRLITNCILYYNAVILSRVKEEKQKNEDFEGIEVLKRISLSAWQHINLYGRYEFTKEEKPIDLIKMIHFLMKDKN